MSAETPEAQREWATIPYMMRRLDGFARGLGLGEATARRIVEQVVADMPLHTDDERVEWARNWLLAAASAE